MSKLRVSSNDSHHITLIMMGPEESLAKEQGLVPILPEDISHNSSGGVSYDIYLFLPSANDFIIFVGTDEPFSELKKRALRKHPHPTLYVRQLDIKAIEPIIDHRIDLNQLPNLDSLGEGGAEKVRSLCQSVLENADAEVEVLLKTLESMADNFIQCIAPDVIKLKENLKKNLNYISVMSDSAAIASLACFCALANNLESSSQYRQIFMATLLMDYPLNKFSLDELHIYYMIPEELQPEVLTELKQHPVHAYKMVSQKLKNFSKETLEIILNHHERYNKKGYPRGIALGNTSLTTQIVSLSVHIFEELKNSLLQHNHGKTLNYIVNTFVNSTSAPEFQNHNPIIINHLKDFLDA